MSDAPMFATVEFYEAVADALNNDPVWLDMAKPITYTMVFVYEEPVNKVFYLSFDEGRITETLELANPTERSADFVITGKPDSWKGVILKTINPTSAMATGKLKVNGKQTVLLRHMKKFSYMIDKMTRIEAVFP